MLSFWFHGNVELQHRARPYAVTLDVYIDFVKKKVIRPFTTGPLLSNGEVDLRTLEAYDGLDDADDVFRDETCFCNYNVADTKTCYSNDFLTSSPISTTETIVATERKLCKKNKSSLVSPHKSAFQT